MNREKAERCLKIGLCGAVLTLIGDLLLGAAKFPDGANMIEGYFAIALAMPAWRADFRRADRLFRDMS